MTSVPDSGRGRRGGEGREGARNGHLLTLQWPPLLVDTSQISLIDVIKSSFSKYVYSVAAAATSTTYALLVTVTSRVLSEFEIKPL